MKGVARSVVAGMVVGVVPALVFGGEPSRDDRFIGRVKPLLEARCVSCHGPDKQEGGLRLDSARALAKGGDGGPAVVPGDPAASRLIQAVRHIGDVPSMPPKQRLTAGQVADLAAWVRDGAVWPERARPAAVAASAGRRIGDAWSDPANPIHALFRGERLDLWSLRPPARPAIPAVRDAAWARTPIDRFVLARLEAAGLRPSPQADRRTLIRRLTFDLTGLPPTPAEVDAFLADGSPDAYERLVDRLLNSPRYGERAARAWLDVVRYADTNGFERDEFRPTMYRYRDYVVRSLNADKTFDRFVREQLAGDEMGGGPVQSPEDADRRIATGYLRLGTYDSTAEIFLEGSKNQEELLADLTNTTGSAFLGLTMACCQCHDHKYDPLSQADHYRLRAFFAAAKRVDDEAVDLPAEREAIDRRNAEVDRRIAEVDARIESLLAPARRKLVDARKAGFPAEIRRRLEAGPGQNDAATEEKLKSYREKLAIDRKEVVGALPEADKRAYEGLAKQVADLEGTKRRHATALVMTDDGRSAPPTRVLAQGDPKQPRQEVPPGFPSVLDPNPATIAGPATETTGRRTALADWIVGRDNPLTSRVIVNRIWQGHFGVGIVATPNDFGYSGARPTHPELLDWLAVDLMDRGWSLKAIHRLIVTSAAYRQGSGDVEASRRVDLENHLIWRQNVRRLDAEALRDAMLAVSGRLLPVGAGPARWPTVPEAVIEGQPAILEARHGDAGGRLQDWYAEPAEVTDVRSLFLVQKRSVPLPLLQPFDLPDMTVSCARRLVTTVAPQALSLLNGDDVIRWSRAFADRVAREAGDNPARRVDRAFRLALARPPSADEAALAADLVRRHAGRYRGRGASPDRLALADLCRALLNLNEFVYFD